jgi:hypothetical protein
VAQYLFLTVLTRLDLRAPEALRVLIWVKAAMLGTFAYITWSGVNTALGRAQGLGRGFLAVMLAVSLGPVVVLAFRYWRARR